MHGAVYAWNLSIHRTALWWRSYWSRSVALRRARLVLGWETISALSFPSLRGRWMRSGSRRSRERCGVSLFFRRTCVFLNITHLNHLGIGACTPCTMTKDRLLGWKFNRHCSNNDIGNANTPKAAINNHDSLNWIWGVISSQNTVRFMSWTRLILYDLKDFFSQNSTERRGWSAD